MTKVSFMGQEFYLRMRPTFPGAKTGILCRVPFTAGKPSDGQKKSRSWLIKTAHALVGTYGAVADAGNGKGGTKLGLEIHRKAPGIGAHVADWKKAHWGAIRKRKTDAEITRRLAEYAT